MTEIKVECDDRVCQPVVVLMKDQQVCVGDAVNGPLAVFVDGVDADKYRWCSGLRGYPVNCVLVQQSRYDELSIAARQVGKLVQETDRLQGERLKLRAVIQDNTVPDSCLIGEAVLRLGNYNAAIPALREHAALVEQIRSLIIILSNDGRNEQNPATILDWVREAMLNRKAVSQPSLDQRTHTDVIATKLSALMTRIHNIAKSTGLQSDGGTSWELDRLEEMLLGKHEIRPRETDHRTELTLLLDRIHSIACLANVGKVGADRTVGDSIDELNRVGASLTEALKAMRELENRIRRISEVNSNVDKVSPFQLNTTAPLTAYEQEQRTQGIRRVVERITELRRQQTTAEYPNTLEDQISDYESILSHYLT